MKNQNSHTTDYFAVVVEYYRAYAERNKTFEDSTYDVANLGGTLERGVSQINTTKPYAFVLDWDFKPIVRYSLKDIWNAVKGEQMRLF